MANASIYALLVLLRDFLLGARATSVGDVLAFLTRSVPRPVFVKVGANDGLTLDPCGDIFLKHDNWHGVLIEPVPYLLSRLRANFSESRFCIVQCAVGPTKGERPFYYVAESATEQQPGLPEWGNQLGSFSREHIVKHENGVFEPFIIEGKVPVEPLDNVLATCPFDSVDFLHIDAEGFDLEVLKSLSLERYQPLAILVEHRHLSEKDRKELQRVLSDSGYLQYRLSFDVLAVRPHFARASAKRYGILHVVRQTLKSADFVLASAKAGSRQPRDH